MARRVDAELRVTFFSFQDIMMCLTGIMVIIALLLIVLNLAESHESAAAAPRSPNDALQVDNDIRVLSQDLDRMEQRRAELASQVQTETGVDSNAMRHELENLKRRKADQEKNIQLTDLERENLLRQIDAVVAAREKVEKSLRIKEREYDEAEIQSSRLLVSVPPNSNGHRWVVIQMESDQILVGPMGAEFATSVLRGPSLDARIQALPAAISPLAPDGVNLLVLIKPSAFGQDDLLIQFLQSKKYPDVGPNPLNEDLWVLRPPVSSGGHS